ncbi:MAG: response regulator transcription factor [Clostridia bacterium]|nr:response regulator transcription factor [Clostridia bacterium]
MRVLVIEDEIRLCDALCHILKEKKYMVDYANDGEDGESLAKSGAYDVIILDIMLPIKNGFEVATSLRQNHIDTPILMLTARDSVSDKVKGLDCGADDYMTKPFSPDELLARVRALTRRQGEFISDEASFGDLSFSRSGATISCGTKEVRLNYKEAQIMNLLISQPSMLYSKDDIIIKVWGYDSEATDTNVEAYISFLRKKLAFVGSKVSIISIKKQGYRLEAGECAK